MSCLQKPSFHGDLKSRKARNSRPSSSPACDCSTDPSSSRSVWPGQEAYRMATTARSGGHCIEYGFIQVYIYIYTHVCVCNYVYIYIYICVEFYIYMIIISVHYLWIYPRFKQNRNDVSDVRSGRLGMARTPVSRGGLLIPKGPTLRSRSAPQFNS